MNCRIFCVVLTLSICGLTDQAQSAARLPGFPLRLEGTADRSPPLAFDVDGDGKLELVIATRSRIHVLEADGSSLPGFPVELTRGAGVATALAVVTGQDSGGALASQILFGTTDGSLACLNGAAGACPGFPFRAAGAISTAPTLGDVNGDGRPDILFGAGDAIVALDLGGRALAGYPRQVGAPVSTPVTRGRFEPNGEGVLVFGDEQGQLHAWSEAGKELPGFPYAARFTLVGQPVFGDVNDDGRFEVVIGSKDYKVHVIRADGTGAPGFPLATGYRIYASCALADLDADGVVDIVVASGDGQVYALRGDATALPGFPVKVGGRLRGAPVVDDLDSDGRLEIALGTDRNELVVLRADGKRYPGFPVRLKDRVEVAPVLADLSGNGLPEIVVLGRDGTLSAYKMLRKGRVRAAMAWPAEGGGATRSGVTGPNPARYRDLVLQPAHPTTVDALSLGYGYFDMDGDAEPATVIHWFQDGKRVEALDGRRQVDAATTRKHQRWYFELRAGPGERLFRSPTVEIANTPPEPPGIALGPDPARTGDALKASIAQASRDVDGDQVRYRVAWLKDRRPQPGLTTMQVAAKRTAKGQRWTVVVTPSDGEVDGLAVRRSLTVANTAPTAARVRLLPARPLVRDGLGVRVDAPGRDADGDKVSYLFLWEAGDKALNLPERGERMPAGAAPKKTKVRVTVTSFDGADRGGQTRAEVEVGNSLPSAPVVRIQPERPTTGDDLVALIDTAASDADRDALTYSFRWRRKGKAYRGDRGAAPLLPASETRKGETWTVELSAHDGQAAGPVGRADVTVANAPPRPAQVQVDAPRPPTDQDLLITQVRPPDDPDGDAAWTDVAWYQGEQRLAQGKDLWRLPAAKTKKHQRYEARLTPTDGIDRGPTSKRWFEVQNSPPVGCQVRIAPAQPKSGQALEAEVAKAPTDLDGDPVRLDYRWYRDGEALAPGARPERVDGQAVRRDQRFTVVATPSDGEVAGPACQAEVVVINQPPDRPDFALLPARPTVLEALNLVERRAPRDADGDAVELIRSWTVDGRPFAAGSGAGPIPAAALRKGQRWQVRLQATDGSLQSEAQVLSAQVQNAAPEKPQVVILPEAPFSSEDLRCRLTAASVDPDGDPLTHRYAWYLGEAKGPLSEAVKGEPAHVGPVLPAAKTRKDQRWICQVTASDGALDSPPALTARQVQNAVPDAPEVQIEPAAPRSNQDLQCRLKREARDPDGDAVRYTFTWRKDGVIQAFAPETDRVPVRLTKAKDIWQCSAAAADGSGQGPVAESAEVLISVD